MADSTEGDTQVQYLGLLASSLIALIAGLVIHSFIIAVNVNDWWKGRSVTPVDHIVTSLGISRICTQCSLSLYIFLSTFFLKNLDSHVTRLIITRVYGFFAYASHWLVTLLAIVFCLKISNLHSRLFSCLRRVILQRTAYFILASILLSAFNSVSTFLLIFTRINKDGLYNTTMDNQFPDCIYINSIYNDTIGAFIPLLFFYISTVLLFTSLYHHTTRMKMSSNLTINLETYYSAMRFVFFTFIYNTIFFTGYFINVFYYVFYCVSLPWLYTFLGFLPVLHSSYLIYRTAKLKNQMSKVLQNVIDLLLQTKGTESKENIEIVAQ